MTTLQSISLPTMVILQAWVNIQPGIRDVLVELIDFSASVEGLLGIQPYHTHFGRSLMPLTRGETYSHRDAVFCEGGRVHGEPQAMELFREGIDSSFLYWSRLSLQQQEGAEHTKAVMCRTFNFKRLSGSSIWKSPFYNPQLTFDQDGI